MESDSRQSFVRGFFNLVKPTFNCFYFDSLRPGAHELGFPLQVESDEAVIPSDLCIIGGNIRSESWPPQANHSFEIFP